VPFLNDAVCAQHILQRAATKTYTFYVRTFQVIIWPLVPVHDAHLFEALQTVRLPLLQPEQRLLKPPPPVRILIHRYDDLVTIFNSFISIVIFNVGQESMTNTSIGLV
jgi:hypothetical protein